MEPHTTPSARDQKAKPVENLPEKPMNEKDANAVKGGAMLRGGDDDLDDLEVER